MPRALSRPQPTRLTGPAAEAWAGSNAPVAIASRPKRNRFLKRMRTYLPLRSSTAARPRQTRESLPGSRLSVKPPGSGQAPRGVQWSAALGKEVGGLLEERTRLRGIAFRSPQLRPGFPDRRLPGGALPHAGQPFRVGQPLPRLGEVAAARAGDRGGDPETDRAGSAALPWPDRLRRVRHHAPAPLRVVSV